MHVDYIRTVIELQQQQQQLIDKFTSQMTLVSEKYNLG